MSQIQVSHLQSHSDFPVIPTDKKHESPLVNTSFANAGPNADFFESSLSTQRKLSDLIHGGTLPTYSTSLADDIEETTVAATAGLNLVEKRTSKTVTKTAVFHLSEDEKASLSLEKFKNLILNKPYSTQPQFMGVPLIAQSNWLGWSGDNHILFQVTGGNMFVSPRMCMVAVHPDTSVTGNKVRVRWDLLNNYNSSSHDFSGAWGQKLHDQGITFPANAIWTPFNQGYWELDLDSGTITYSLTTDPGGSLLFNPDDAFVSYPNFVVNEILGLSGEFEIV